MLTPLRTTLLIGTILAACPLAAQGKPPWKAGDPAPALLGLHLGDTRARLDSLLGPSDGKQELGERVLALSYTARQVTVTWSRLDGVAVIDLRSRESGEIGGVRVGDTIQSLVERWGPPPQGEGTTGLYVFGAWAIVVRSDTAGEKIVMLSLGRVM